MYQHHHFPALGTNLTVIVGDGATAELADAIDTAVVTEVDRLEGIFTIFRADSELQRWKRGEVGDPSPEFCEVMGRALDLQLRSGGSFNPAVTEISALWRAAVDRPPSPHAVATAVESVAAPRFEMRSGRPVAVGDVTHLQLHAFAKGWIVDRALDHGLCAARHHADSATIGMIDVIVNAGGDLIHRGPNAQSVGIENPLRPYDNEPPVARVALRNAGLATSGRARQGFQIAGRWYSHVIDPRSGYPVDHAAAVSVIAEHAADADVIATVAGVEEPMAALDTATAWGAACLVIGLDGTAYPNAAWDALAR